MPRSAPVVARAPSRRHDDVRQVRPVVLALLDEQGAATGQVDNVSPCLNISQTLLRRFGIAVYLYYRDVGQHNAPHIHVMYRDEEAVIGIPGRALRKVRAWIELYDDELEERWALAVRGEPITRID